MSLIEEMFRNASSAMTNKEAESFLRGLLGDRPETFKSDATRLAEALGVPNCNQPDCSIHGSEEADPDLLTDEDMERMTSGQAWNFMISSTAAAHNALVKNEARKATLIMAIAELWQSVANRLEVEETRAKMDEVPAEDKQPSPVE